MRPFLVLSSTRMISGVRMAKLKGTNMSSASSTRNEEELDKFRAMAGSWWDRDGPCKALHSMNALRVNLVREGIQETKGIKASTADVLKGIDILDVGCGGGILCEPLARIGANVTGLEAAEQSLEVAREHAKGQKGLKLEYVCSTIEDFVRDNPEVRFDAVVASEVLEHVESQPLFMESCSRMLKPGGSIFVTTINRSRSSYAAAILAAECFLGLLPKGTHDFSKFVTPEELEAMLERSGCSVRLVHGMFYWPVFNSWSWTSSTAVNYAVHAVKVR